MNIKIGQTLELTIEKLGIHGEGVGTYGHLKVYVNGALPGEIVSVQIYEVRRNFARGCLEEILLESPERVLPPCPLFGKCGGCQIMHLNYTEQLAVKRSRVGEAFQHRHLPTLQLLPCVPSPKSLSYRNKMQLPSQTVAGHLLLGLYARDSHDLVDIERCFVHADQGERVYHLVREILKASRLTAYNPTTGLGDLRYVLIKTAVHTDQVLVTFVTHGEGPDFLSTLAKEIMARDSSVRGVVQNINPAVGNVVLGEDYRTLSGRPDIEEILLGLHFKISSASFFQVNPFQAENLYSKTVELAEVGENDTVLDAYCGVGTLSLLLARKAGKVLGVESVDAAIWDAKENAKRNGLSNVEFICAHAEEFIPTLTHLDVAVLNPPRKGCHPNLLEKLAFLKPKRIIYVSCDPDTLARDVEILTSKGYRMDVIQPFDMFPQTMHVETVVRLSI